MAKRKLKNPPSLTLSRMSYTCTFTIQTWPLTIYRYNWWKTYIITHTEPPHTYSMKNTHHMISSCLSVSDLKAFYDNYRRCNNFTLAAHNCYEAKKSGEEKVPWVEVAKYWIKSEWLFNNTIYDCVLHFKGTWAPVMKKKYSVDVPYVCKIKLFHLKAF